LAEKPFAGNGFNQAAAKCPKMGQPLPRAARMRDAKTIVHKGFPGLFNFGMFFAFLFNGPEKLGPCDQPANRERTSGRRRLPDQPQSQRGKMAGRRSSVGMAR
jgi:hypothetical protein